VPIEAQNQLTVHRGVIPNTDDDRCIARAA
jgi:hypothetical protein